MSSPTPYFDNPDDLGPLPPWVDREEAAQVVEVARLEASRFGFDPESAARDALRQFVLAESSRCRREKPATAAFRDPDRAAADIRCRLGWLSDASKVKSLTPARSRTEGQRGRFLRNQVIFAATLAGFSERELARVFDLPHSRVHAIIEEMRRRTDPG